MNASVKVSVIAIVYVYLLTCTCYFLCSFRGLLNLVSYESVDENTVLFR